MDKRFAERVWTTFQPCLKADYVKDLLNEDEDDEDEDDEEEDNEDVFSFLRLMETPLVSYAARNWGWHVLRALPKKRSSAAFNPVQAEVVSLEDTVLELLGTKNFLRVVNDALSPTLQAVGRVGSNYSYLWWDNSEDDPLLSPLHILAHFSLHGILGRWLAMDEFPGTRRSHIIDTFTSTNHGYTALWQACRAGKADTALFLLEKGADPELENGDQEFALHEACFRGLFKVVNHILELPNRVGEKCVKNFDAEGRSSLTLAILSDHGAREDIVRLLIKTIDGMDDGQSVLFHRRRRQLGLKISSDIHEAAERDDTTIIRMLVQTRHGQALLDQRGIIDSEDTALHHAVWEAKVNAARTLIDLGANTSARRRHGLTPLHDAVLVADGPDRSRREVMELLLEHSDPMLVDDAERNILHIAAACGHRDHIETAVKQIDTSTLRKLLIAKHNRGATPLAVAARKRANAWKAGFNICYNR